METEFPDARLAANSAATCQIRISGSGNLTFVQAPKLSLPGSFEQYNLPQQPDLLLSSRGPRVRMTSSLSSSVISIPRAWSTGP